MAKDKLSNLVEVTIKKCHDCGVKEGQLHSPGCDMERCPICGRQIITCGCKVRAFSKVKYVPYIVYPVLCSRCGKLWPEMFSTLNEEWKKYIQIDQRHSVLCQPCFDEIKVLIDG